MKDFALASSIKKRKERITNSGDADVLLSSWHI